MPARVAPRSNEAPRTEAYAYTGMMKCTAMPESLLFTSTRRVLLIITAGMTARGGWRKLNGSGTDGAGADSNFPRSTIVWSLIALVHVDSSRCWQGDCRTIGVSI